MSGFWKDIINTLLNTIYHGALPEVGNTWCEEYELETKDMVKDIKVFHGAITNAGMVVSNAEMAKFLLYTEAIHIGNSHIIGSKNVSEALLIFIAADINDELN